MNPIIIIPARMGAMRLPQKPLADIQGKPMIQHVWERAVQAAIAPVVVATDHQEIADLIQSQGGQAVMTDAVLPSGSDRVYHALEQIDPQGVYDVAINLQGDLPNIDPVTIQKALTPLAHSEFDVATLVAPITDQSEIENPSVVKVALGGKRSDGVAQAFYFSRAPIPYGEGPHYHHIGIYAYRRPVLQQFVALPPSPLELQERLEQMRLIEQGIRFGVDFVEQVPVSVDTSADLERARLALAA